MPKQAIQDTPTSGEKNPDATVWTLNSKITFGKYRNRIVDDIVSDDPTYLHFVNEHVPFIIVPPEILSLTYDEAPKTTFAFDLPSLIKAHNLIKTSFEGHTMPTSIAYTLAALGYLIKDLKANRSVTIKVKS